MSFCTGLGHPLLEHWPLHGCAFYCFRYSDTSFVMQRSSGSVGAPASGFSNPSCGNNHPPITWTYTHSTPPAITLTHQSLGFIVRATESNSLVFLPSDKAQLAQLRSILPEATSHTYTAPDAPPPASSMPSGVPARAVMRSIAKLR
eukprot:1159869-Pelagomonas_calceolata.AAC.6